ncbi:MAG TPA: hypothetical protein VNQ90_15795 [Chthoniobacteraceae bacterium]|nr:hypothetical protein [Chthoniobacteraceae bacterium]
MILRFSQKWLLAAVAALPLFIHPLKASTEGYEPTRRIGFHTDGHGVTPFGDPLPLVRRVTDGQTQKHLLRMEATAAGSPVGLRVPLPVTGGPRLVKVATALQGRGSALLTLRSGDGAVTSRPLPLQGHRRWDSFYYRVDRHGEELVAELTLPNPREGDYVEVSSIDLRTKAVAEAGDLPVPPRFYEAGDWIDPASTATRVENWSGGVLLTSRTSLEALPMPQTSRPLTLYVEYRSPEGDATLERIATDGSSRQVSGASQLPRAEAWQWHRVPGINPRLLGKSLTLRWTPPQGGALEIHRIVVTSEAELPPAQLEAVAPVLPPAPLVAAAPSAKRHDLRARLEEGPWKGATAFGDFRVSGSRRAPTGATTVRFSYDGEKLYVRFDCEEPILRSVEQRTHEFRTTATEPDGPVQEDDGCFLAFRSREGEVLFFRINARGVIRDSRQRGESVDVRWNAGAEALGRIGEGRYTVVAAIPLHALGLDAHVGQVPMSVGRNAVARSEVTTWNAGADPESPAGWGTLVFDHGSRRAAFSPKLPETISVGENGFRMASGEVSTSGLVYTSFREGEHRSRQIVVVSAGMSEARLEVPRALGQRVVEPSVTLLADDLTPLYRSPLHPVTVAMPSVTLRLRKTGAYVVRMKGREEANGNAGDQPVEITLPLKTGANEVEISMEQPTGTAVIEGPGFDAGSIQWTTEPDGKAVRKRTTLLLEQTRVWPRPEPAIYFARDAAQQVPFLFETAEGREGWKLHVALPRGFEWVGASSLWAWRSELHPRFVTRETGRRKIGGEEYTMLEIAADRRLPKKGDTPRLAQALSLWLVLRPTSQASASGEIYYWSTGEGGRVTEARRSFPVRVLAEPLAGGQLAKSLWQLWGPLEQLDDDAVREALLAMTRRAGINLYEIGHVGITPGRFREKGIPATLRMHFLNGSLFFGPYLGKHPEQCLVNYDGKIDHSRVCTSALLQEAWPEAERLMQAQIAAFRPQAVLYDYEFSPLYRGRMHTCYCPRCLAAFRSAAALPESVRLDAPVINEKYARPWVDFMARQTARIFGKMKASVKAVDPKIRFEVYSGYQTEDNPSRYGVDWAYVGAAGAVDQAGMGYGRPLEAIRATKKALPGVFLLFGEIIEPYRPVDDIPSRQTTPARLLRRMLDSQGGVLIYEMSAMDARSWRAVAETTRLLARYETVLMEGAQEEIPGIGESEGCRVAHGGTALYCLMNDSPLEKRWRLPEAALAGGREFYSGEPLDGEGWLVVPPGESRVVVVEKEAGNRKGSL